MAILEAKLSSVPGLEGAAAAADTSAIPDVATSGVPASTPSGVPAPGAPPSPASGEPVPSPAPTNAASGPPAKEDPVYSTYFKLMRLGMPLEQVKLKCESEGYNPDVLDHPDDPVPQTLALADAAGSGPAVQSNAPESTSVVSTDGGATADSTEIVPVAGDGAAAVDENVMKVKDDPEYKKYFKMLAVGIPPPVVKHKMTMDGYDDGILDMDPNSPSPNA